MRARRLLLVPLLSPLLAVLLVAALNPRPQVSFRVLTWVTPPAPLGVWLAAAALGGAACSGVGVTLALRQGSAVQGRRRSFRRAPEPWTQSDADDGRWQDVDAEPAAGTRRKGRSPSNGDDSEGFHGSEAVWREAPRTVAPPRSPGDPAPTLDAPFRILRRATTATEGASARAAGGTATAASPRREAIAVDAAEDWGHPAAVEDW